MIYFFYLYIVMGTFKIIIVLIIVFLLMYYLNNTEHFYNSDANNKCNDPYKWCGGERYENAWEDPSFMECINYVDEECGFGGPPSGENINCSDLMTSTECMVAPAGCIFDESDQTCKSTDVCNQTTEINCQNSGCFWDDTDKICSKEPRSARENSDECDDTKTRKSNINCLDRCSDEFLCSDNYNSDYKCKLNNNKCEKDYNIIRNECNGKVEAICNGNCEWDDAEPIDYKKCKIKSSGNSEPCNNRSIDTCNDDCQWNDDAYKCEDESSSSNGGNPQQYCDMYNYNGTYCEEMGCKWTGTNCIDGNKVEATTAAATTAAATTAAATTAAATTATSKIIDTAIWSFNNIDKDETIVYNLPNLPNHYPDNGLKEDNKIYLFKMNMDSEIVLDINEDLVGKPMTIAFYIQHNQNIELKDYDLLTISGDGEDIVLAYKKINNEIQLYKKKNDKLTLISDFNIPNIDLNKDAKYGINWISIKIDVNKLILNINNVFIKTKTFKFSFNKITFNKFDGYIGRIILFNNIMTDEYLCSRYQCYKNYSKCMFNLKNIYTNKVNDPRKWINMGSKNAIKCIEGCKNSHGDTCNVIDCQKICLECQDYDDNKWTLSEKKRICPWYENIKIIGLATPDKPEIRGYTKGDGVIIIEWKSPSDGSSKITNYILEIKETNTDKNSKIILLDDMNNCSLCEYKINNLKKNVSYDIYLTAKNNGGIGEKSNKITIKTTGKEDSISSIYDDMNNNYITKLDYLYKCNKTKNTGHILDNINLDSINVFQSINK